MKRNTTKIAPAEARLNLTDALPFMLAGKAKFTLRSVRTGERLTYKVKKSEDPTGQYKTSWFVSVAEGSTYVYIGMIGDDQKSFRLTAKSRLAENAAPVVAFRWFFTKLAQGIDAPNVEFWHAGKCGRCGRDLVVPESIALGFGAECLQAIRTIAA